MPHSTSAKKRVKQNEKAREHNKAKKSEMRTQLKKVRQAITDGDKAAAEAALPRAMKLLDKAARHNIIHTNKAAREKARLRRDIDAI
jgi:small subunit ribosomal protein S20